MKNDQTKSTGQAKKPKADPKREDGVPVNDPQREQSVNGGHQGSTGQRDKHDR